MLLNWSSKQHIETKMSPERFWKHAKIWLVWKWVSDGRIMVEFAHLNTENITRGSFSISVLGWFFFNFVIGKIILDLIFFFFFFFLTKIKCNTWYSKWYFTSCAFLLLETILQLPGMFLYMHSRSCTVHTQNQWWCFMHCKHCQYLCDWYHVRLYFCKYFFF